MRVIIRTECGDEVGYGHLSRCLAMSEALMRHDVHVELIVSGGEVGALALPDSPLLSLSFTAQVLGSQEDVHTIRGRVRASQPNWIFVDSYSVNSLYFQAIQSGAVRFGYIGECVPPESNLDLYVLPGVAESSVDRIRDAVILSGKDYILLRDEYREGREIVRAPSNIEKVLVTVGGSDERNDTATILRELPMQEFESVSVIIGPSFPYENSLHEFEDEKGAHLRLVRRPKSLVQYLRESDLVICASGITLWETACIGCLCIMGLTAANQERNYELFLKSNAALGIGSFLDCEERLGEAIKQIRAENPNVLVQRMRQMSDGMGADRVAKFIIAESRGSDGE